MFEELPGAAFSLASRDPRQPAPVLTGVVATGKLDALLFELTVRQTYRNTGPRVLEVVYTFPLPPMAVLLGFASELNGARQEGVIVAKHEAEQRYERALEEGDAPVMLEALGDGLHTANIGNLKPGDEIVLEARYAQWLSFEQGRLRLSIPTTIAPRYGSAEQAGLQPQQVPQYDLAADYPLQLSLIIGEALAGAAVECPTHRFTQAPAQPEQSEHLPAKGPALRGQAHRSVRLELAPGARLDRDVIVVVTPREPRPSLIVTAEDAFDEASPVVMMAALQPPPAAPRERVCLKLLVDCSGSMAGDAIASALAALRGTVAGLTERDRISLSRFGSAVEHLLAPAEASLPTLKRLRPIIDGIVADMGGTEMEAAFNAVFKLGGDGAEGAPSDVLIITDGEIWRAEETVAAAQRSGHRVFAIGVGSAPAEGVLRALAQATGGACEFATPGEALEAAARRMLQRMRQPLWRNARVEWGGVPAWQVGPGACVFGGDTAVALAGFAKPPRAGEVRLLADDAQGAAGAAVERARGEAGAPCAGDSLARMAAARRMALADEEQAFALALRYQLMSRQTSCVLVHQREGADKAAEPAALHVVKSMPAAGWGGAGVIMAAASTSLDFFDGGMGSSRSLGGMGGVEPVRACELLDLRSLTERWPSEPTEPLTLEDLAWALSKQLEQLGQLAGLAAIGAEMSLHEDARQALDEALHVGLSPDEAWLALAHWVNGRANGLADERLAARLQAHVATIEPALMARATQIFDRLLGRHANTGWATSREERLRRAMGWPGVA